MSTRKLRAAVIGAGYVASHHLAALKTLDFVDIVAICDTNLDAARTLAQRYGGQALPNVVGLRELRPDIVHVLTPPASHPLLAMLALDMGAHVLVEKPMADTVADCAAMIDKARAAGRELGVNHSDLFDPVVEQALQAVRAGRVGEVVSVDIIRNSEYPPYAGGPLPGMVAQGSYPFRDLGVHGLYTLEAFLGALSPPQVDYRSSGRDPNLLFDEWHALVQGKHGTGRLLLSWNARPMENRLVVRGTRGTIEVDRFLQTCRLRRVLPGPKFVGILLGGFLDAARDLVRIPWNVMRFATGSLKPSPGIRRGATEFVLAIRDGRAPPFGGEDAWRFARLLETACAEPDRLRRHQLESHLLPLEPVDTLVTGAGGFLGQALVAALRTRGQRVRVLLRRPIAEYLGASDMQTVVGDLGDPAIVEHAVAGATTIYHVGAAMRGGPREFEAGTVWGTRNVVAACLKHRPRRLVHVSSLSVLDHAGRDSSRPITEQSALEPHPEWRGAYTQTKGIAEAC
ncbi:MAG TPA: Gfo/Idh/MocA family oxidoreductase, partial [Lysobacter sp.]|nr:Gfo/Idh/MocA family oxidoreductase [Lysobacter sp.]